MSAWIPWMAACAAFLAGFSFCWAETKITQQDLDAERQPGFVDYAPADGSRCAMNPPTFVWLPVKGVKEYTLQWSRNPAFPQAETTTVQVPICIYAPRQVFDPGKWHWRFGVNAAGAAQPLYSKTRAFEVAAAAPKVPLPDVKEVVRKLTGLRPRDFVRPDELPRWREMAKT